MLPICYIYIFGLFQSVDNGRPFLGIFRPSPIPFYRSYSILDSHDQGLSVSESVAVRLNILVSNTFFVCVLIRLRMG